ncbi:hypothetical protein PG911_06475 [Tenacibaculum ovolyticum]|uniref:ExbD/TolR family protein n=1 Tax=Tenacibaculum ovolyticum TaxID=104270 RepID=UPI0022F40036|nr:hypothetical protein [Tenacibaculum ovolyticum]WBX77896.1 hypothetical protein PG911_06475 [Tenacibaculum ovolyticum]
MRNIYFLVFNLIFLFGCNNSKKIEGHWHLTPKFVDFEYHTLDIINYNDTVAYSEKYTFDSYTIRHQPKERYLISGECGGFFSYVANQKYLYMKNVQDYGDYIGEKHELTNSHILKDYRKNLLVNVNFPKISNPKLTKQDELPIGSEIENITIGIPKYSKDVFYKEKIRLQVRDKYIEITELDEYLEEVKSRYSDNNLPFINFRLIADKNVPNQLIITIKEKLNKANFQRVFLTCLKNDFNELGNLFEYIELKNIELNKSKKITDILQ